MTVLVTALTEYLLSIWQRDGIDWETRPSLSGQVSPQNCHLLISEAVTGGCHRTFQTRRYRGMKPKPRDSFQLQQQGNHNVQQGNYKEQLVYQDRISAVNYSREHQKGGEGQCKQSVKVNNKNYGPYLLYTPNLPVGNTNPNTNLPNTQNWRHLLLLTWLYSQLPT